jgi:hypothetical protein
METSVEDPDPYDGSGFRREKMAQKYRKWFKNFIF